MQNLDMALSRLSRLTGIPACRYALSGALLTCYQFPLDTQHLPAFYTSLVQELLAACVDGQIVWRQVEDLPILLLAYRVSASSSCYIWGPVSYTVLTYDQQEKYDSLCREAQIENHLCMASLDQITTELTLFAGIQVGRDIFQEELCSALPLAISEDEIQQQAAEALQRQALHREENHTLAEESPVIDAMRRGDTAFVENFISGDTIQYPQVLADVKKNEEYMAVAATSYICRIATASGVSSTRASHLRDGYLRRISQCETASDCMRVRNACLLAFTQLIAEHREDHMSTGQSRRVKQYVQEHITEKIFPHEIAAALHTSQVSLARQFKEHQGCTITQYIQRQKIAQAKTLLVYTDDPIDSISAYLGFESPNYFARVFRQVEGTSPSAYRRENHAPLHSPSP